LHPDHAIWRHPLVSPYKENSDTLSFAPAINRLDIFFLKFDSKKSHGGPELCPATVVSSEFDSDLLELLVRRAAGNGAIGQKTTGPENFWPGG